MHLKSITLKGFKSFPDRTTLDFTPGVSVVVGPNGSGKSNITDAVLWAMGEQSPLAVRGQSMQDVIFGGGRGVQARSSAEVEIVLDNADGAIDMPVGELSIQRRLDRNGDGEYRLNGARCRLIDVLEVLSDTGLGKEMHSVISQGRVEMIVTSKPRDRRLLIEEAAGLGKHRKRRRRAQLKLDRTQDNLDRALDIEREARSRLRPLKRQAEAAELHARLERQTDEARWELARDVLRARREELSEASSAAAAARELRDATQAELAEVAARREAAEQALARRGEQHEAMTQRVYRARGASDRVSVRLERTRETAVTIAERAQRRESELKVLREQVAADTGDEAGGERIATLESELAELDAHRDAQRERELASLRAQADEAAAQCVARAADVERCVAALREADEACEFARLARRAAETSAEAARREAARVGAELAAANQFLRSHAGAPGDARSLTGALVVEPGCELALAAVLGGRLDAAVVDDLAAARTLLDDAGRDGGWALVAGDGGAHPAAHPPCFGARALGDLISGPDDLVAVARRLLHDAWLVDNLSDLRAGFAGVAVTAAGRAWFASTRELRQAADGGAEQVLARRNARDVLIAQSEGAVQAEQAALDAVTSAQRAVDAADATRDGADRALRDAGRAHGAPTEEHRRLEWLIEQREAAPDQGEAAVRRAQVEGELAAERRNAQRAAEERAARAARVERLASALARDRALVPVAQRLATVLESTLGALQVRLEVLDAELAADREAGEGVAGELRACAATEAEIQARLREHGEAVTMAEVRAQQVRDADADAAAELTELAAKLELSGEPADEPLSDEDADALRGRIERLARRREQLGPVNPLAQGEYEQALEHVEELERQRVDLETALRELRQLIRDTDRQIRESFEETFTAAAENFERLAEQLFPGGRGRLRLVREDSGPRPVLGGAEVSETETAAEAAEDAAEAEEAGGEAGLDPDDDLGVEIEITPSGKAMKRLMLMSGGEKSMTAIAFLFSVFLARPCPFYILDEVEAALDDLNIGRFLDLLRANAGRAQFIVVTHQKRTMEAADTLYGVSMADDGVSKVISRRLPREVAAAEAAA
jgi:chromosome segregation protein